MDGFDQVIGNYTRPGVHTAKFSSEGVVATFYRGRSPLELDEDVAAQRILDGQPTWTECDFLRLEFPGDTKKVWDQPVKAGDAKRFPAEWNAYQSGQVMAGGTALTAWSLLSPSDVKKFNGLSIYTVEQLAEVSDGNLSGLGLGGREAREEARLFILKREADKPQAVTDEIAQLRAQVAALTEAQTKPRRTRADTAPLEQEAA